MIRRYNVRAKKWIDGGLEEFRNQQFVVYMNEVPQNAESGSFESRPYYPVADKCYKRRTPRTVAFTLLRNTTWPISTPPAFSRLWSR